MKSRQQNLVHNLFTAAWLLVVVTVKIFTVQVSASDLQRKAQPEAVRRLRSGNE
jgi:hypothetical protein